MIQTERNQRKTDQAWNKLYERLDKESLLPTTSHSPTIRLKRWTWGTAIAATIALCLYFSAAHFSGGEHPEIPPLLTQQNQETSTLVTTLEDGSIVYLAGKTSLQYPKHFAPARREVSLQGDALFDITGNRTRPFLIETEEARIEVLGTAFNVKSDGNTPFELSVQRGEVKVTLKKNGQETYVKAGETVTLLAQKLQLSVTNNFAQFARYTGNIRFKDERLANILRVINLREHKTCLQTSPELGERILTVSFSNDSPETMAELICLALNLRYSRQKDVLTLSE